MARPPGPPAPARLRIESIALTDFRAFAGPSATVIPFGRDRKTDCNLLLYGENGAGKSSLFEALRGLFARKPVTRLFKRERNVFSQAPETDAKVEMRFNDGDQALDQAQAFLNDGHLAAAATYTRTAFELGLRQWAEKGSVKLRFRNDPGDLSSQELLEAIRQQKGSDPASPALPVLKELEMYRSVVLNPLSHATPPGIQKSEVQGAITAVRFMLSVSRQR